MSCNEMRLWTDAALLGANEKHTLHVFDFYIKEIVHTHMSMLSSITLTLKSHLSSCIFVLASMTLTL